MGLRTASVRHSRREDMAPALTDPNQTQTFKLSANHSVSPINESDKNGEIYVTREASLPITKDLNDVYDNVQYTAELLKTNKLKASGNCGLNSNFIMSEPMGDEDNKMGIQKTGIDEVSALLKDKSDAEVDQLFNNLGTSGDIAQNVDDIMQVIKSMEGGSTDRLSSVQGDISGEQDNIFPLSTSDLTGNLTNLEKELFNDVDVMNMNLEEQLIDGNKLKETQTKELLGDVKRKQAKLERQLDFLLRRIRKFQVRNMGQHISSEVAGVFEHVHRTLRKCKESSSLQLPVKTEDSNVSLSTIPSEDVKPTPLERLKPISYSSTKNLVKKLEGSTLIQANNYARQRHSSRYFGSGSMEPSTFRASASGLTTLPAWSPQEKQDFQKVTGFSDSQLRLVQEELDSEATVSSSGGESCDEMQSYNNPHQQYLAIQKRAAWKYAVDRAAIASRWTWLQSQISDLEYRIRQHSDLHRKIRASKEKVQLGGVSPVHSLPSSPTCINGYRGQLPGASPIKNSESQINNLVSKTFDTSVNGTITNACPDIQCARTRPVVNFRKRKLMQFTSLHAVSKKAARPSSIRCGCVPPTEACALCTGRTDPTHPRDVSEYLSKNEKLGLLDPSFHPVFSLCEDASATLHMEAIMRTPDWQQRSSRSNMKAMKFLKTDRVEKPNVTGPEHRSTRKLEHRKKYNRLIKPSTVNALSAKIKSRYRNRKGIRHSSISRLKKKSRIVSQLQSLGSDGADEEVESLGINSTGKYDSPSTSPLLSAPSASGFPRRNRVDSYDIDNIIIPYSVAASTRVEKLPYKEIPTPKWRIAETDYIQKFDLKNNGIVKTSQEDEDAEDVSDDAVLIRHENCEQEEKKRFLSYMKLPIGYGRSRANRRTDSRAESSGANTPDPMSPAPIPVIPEHLEPIGSPVNSPSITPILPEESVLSSDNTTSSTAKDIISSINHGLISSISTLRKRTTSQSRITKDKDNLKEETRSATPEQIEELPYEKRDFPLSDETYDKLMKSLPEDLKLKTNTLSQDYVSSPISDYDDKIDYHDSESTESAFGDEDPNDPEWDVEGNKDRYRR